MEIMQTPARKKRPKVTLWAFFALAEKNKVTGTANYILFSSVERMRKGENGKTRFSILISSLLTNSLKEFSAIASWMDRKVICAYCIPLQSFSLFTQTAYLRWVQKSLWKWQAEILVSQLKALTPLTQQKCFRNCLPSTAQRAKYWFYRVKYVQK